MVLDASALLALLHNEPGAAHVNDAIDGGIVSAVNWSEVVQKSLHRGVNVDGMLEEFSEVGLVVEPFTAELAESAARLWEATKHQGLSLADRACLALALERKEPVLTADRTWGDLELQVDIQLLR